MGRARLQVSPSVMVYSALLAYRLLGPRVRESCPPDTRVLAQTVPARPTASGSAGPLGIKLTAFDSTHTTLDFVEQGGYLSLYVLPSTRSIFRNSYPALNRHALPIL